MPITTNNNKNMPTSDSAIHELASDYVITVKGSGETITFRRDGDRWSARSVDEETGEIELLSPPIGSMVETLNRIEREEREEEAHYLAPAAFIIAVEDGTITQEQFSRSVRSFITSGQWLHLQGSWHRQVALWLQEGL